MPATYNLILGPIQVGNIMNCVLMGTLIMQAYNYYSTFNDPRWMRIAVAFALLLDTVQTGVMCYMQWEFTITNFSNVANLAVPGWAIGSIPFWSVPVAWMVQFFYSWRIFQLTNRHKLIPIIIAVLSIIQGLAGLGSGIGAFMVTSIADFPKLNPIAGIWFGGSLVCDLLITMTMVIVLQRSRTGLKDSDNIVDSLIRIVVETGAATTFIVLLDTIFFFRLPHTNLHLAVVMIAGKTYSNSMLYTLNARSSMRHRSNIHNTTGIVGNVRKTMTMTDLVFTNPALREGSDATKTVDRPVHCSIGRTNSQRAVVGDHETHIIVDELRSPGLQKVHSIPCTESLDAEDHPYYDPEDTKTPAV